MFEYLFNNIVIKRFWEKFSKVFLARTAVMEKLLIESLPYSTIWL